MSAEYIIRKRWLSGEIDEAEYLRQTVLLRAQEEAEDFGRVTERQGARLLTGGQPE